METGGPATAFERFIRFVAGDANWERLEPDVQKRMLASATTYFGVESGAFDSYLPSEETLASSTTPVKLVVSAQSHAFFPKPPADWLTCSASTSHGRPGRVFRMSTIPRNSCRTSSRFFGASARERIAPVSMAGGGGGGGREG